MNISTSGHFYWLYRMRPHSILDCAAPAPWRLRHLRERARTVRSLDTSNKCLGVLREQQQNIYFSHVQEHGAAG